jgi:hypothetical protein
VKNIDVKNKKSVGVNATAIVFVASHSCTVNSTPTVEARETPNKPMKNTMSVRGIHLRIGITSSFEAYVFKILYIGRKLHPT